MADTEGKKEVILGIGVKIVQNGLHLTMMYVIANLLMANCVMNARKKRRKRTVENNGTASKMFVYTLSNIYTLSKVEKTNK